MEFSTTLWLWVGVAGMTAGTLPTAYRLLLGGENRDLSAVLFGITGIAAVAYLIMAFGYGTITVAGSSVEIVRYTDWLLTTPLMVLYLALLSQPGRRVIGALVAVDAVVIVAGVAATAAGGITRYLLFGVGTLAYLVLVWLLVRTLPRRASFASTRQESAFVTLRNLTVVVWTLYPVVWLLAPTGVGLLLPETQVLVFTYLDIVSKVGFVAVALRGMRDLATAETELGVGAD
ncbi:bacteriorhodopsin [Halobellus rarus]|uniref:Bacteriorhodopsin n=1 Tax=Halobellus rarus TaxID=1126237 RepID=A0ABD6CM12_9EURY|nr:bacteriorhodopsin [Halobellus rarus]